MADRENFMGGRHRTTRPHAVTAQRRGPGLYWLPFQRGYDRCRITVHRESPRPRPATSENNLIHALAWFGSTISRAPFHAGGRTVERSAYRPDKSYAEYGRSICNLAPSRGTSLFMTPFLAPYPRRASCPLPSESERRSVLMQGNEVG